jgi:DNA polymerase I-like protein with 3'-5' exonuclease and polymerase domains
VHRPYGKEIRECLIAPEGYELCGSDQAGLEDRTKQHYIYDWDPDYVSEMLSEDWDPHLDIGLTSGMLTKEQVQDYKSGDPEKIKEIKPIRHKAKTTNYSCTYGAFPPKIAKSAGIPIEEAKDLFEAYWKRNWAIKKVASLCRTKTLEGQTWLWNPVSGLWYSLRFEKDKFSTLNQGTGSFCFDVWLGFILKKRPEITAQFHDEGVFCIKKGYRKEMEDLLNEAIEEANEALGLNRRLDITVEFGDSYAEIH